MTKSKILIVFDTTGSMHDVLVQFSKFTDYVLEKVFSTRNVDVEVAFGVHGDYVDEETLYLTKYTDFCGMSNKSELEAFLIDAEATSGGDVPECYEHVLREVQSKFVMDGSRNTLIMIGDSMPHSMNSPENRYNIDWEKEATTLWQEMGVRIYSIFSTATITLTEELEQAAFEFWKELSNIGGGCFIQLDSIEEIVKYVLAICLTETGRNDNEINSMMKEDRLASYNQKKDGAILNALRPMKKNRPIKRTSRPASRNVGFPKVSTTPTKGATKPTKSAAGWTKYPEQGATGFSKYPDQGATGFSKAFSRPESYEIVSSDSKPWRKSTLEFTKGEYDDLRQKISERKPLNAEAKAYKILLVGQIKAGKSSVINTIYSALKNQLGQITLTANEDESVTKKFRVYSLRRSNDERALPVTICDTMGYEEYATNFPGPTLRDMEYIITGHIMDNYEFKPESIGFGNKFFNKKPTKEDEVNVIVIVVEACTAGTLNPDVITTLKKVLKLANEKDIRCVVLLTKIDDMCADTKQNLGYVFRSQLINDCVNNVHENLGLNISNILPMKNYSSETTVDTETNVLALYNLKKILDFADDTFVAQNAKMAADLPQPDPLLDEPFLKVKKEDVQSYWNHIWGDVTQVPNIRIALVGPMSAGKSEFINGVMSEMNQSIVNFADTGRGDRPRTTTYKEYQVKSLEDNVPIQLLDTMGFSDRIGLINEDVGTILDGLALNGSTFNYTTPLRPKSDKVGIKDKVHMLGIVLNGAAINDYSPEIKQKIVDARNAAQRKDIPFCVVVTHIDELCPHVKKNAINMIRSPYLTTCIEKISDLFQMKRNIIYPVVNYKSESEVAWEKSVFILRALSEMKRHAVLKIPNTSDEKTKGWLSRFW